MKSKSKLYSMQRAAAAALIVSLQWQGLTAAHAAVSQLPGLYTTPPDSNVMFTLDDSGSMTSDAIPDFDEADPNLPSNASSNYFYDPSGSSFNGTKLPNMWGSGSSYLTATYYSIDSATARYLRSSAGNPLYYDRNVTYLPWPRADDNTKLNDPANPKKVNIHPEDPFNTSRTIDLTAQLGSGSSKFWPATYFVYTGSTPLPTSSVSLPSRIESTQNVKANFSKIEITSDDNLSYARPATRTDCSASVCTATQERQNFANWLQYYRSRTLMAKGGVAIAFAKQGSNLRVGLASLNASGNVRRGVAKFSGSSRQAFFTELYSITASGGTPLRQAMDNIGKYFQRSNIGNPWAQDPTSTSTVGTEYSCRRSFHILSTDGLWNGAAASDPGSRNNDSFSGSTPAKPDGTTYTYSDTATSDTDPLVARFSTSPFADGRSNTLADVAAYYWKTDLRPDLKNDASPTARDPAFWQHLTTFTVGMGINGTGGVTKTVGSNTVAVDIATQAGRDLLIANRTPLNWTAPAAENAATGDDLIHASMNGRGRYFSATNPTELSNGLTSALVEAADTPVDLAAVAADSPQIAAGGVIYQGTFSPRGWYGRLYAFPQNASNGAVNTNPGAAKWEASNKMPAFGARKIFTIDTSGTSAVGKNFTWSELNTAQKAALNDDATLLDYLRGSKARELSQNGPFRDRPRYTVAGVEGGVLGDIVNGAPIRGPDAGGSYDRLPNATEAASYSSFRSGSTLNNMRSTLFVAANDGMLHAFDTDTGVERFAYVPNSVFSVPYGGTNEKRLAMLADLAYPHRFLVDGPPNIADAYLNGGWKTLAVTSTGAGAKSLFALDVTDTVVGPTGFGTGKVLWEFSQANSADMGHVLGYPHVARMRNGAWAVLTGNGYDSQNGQAKLFVLNAATGAIIKEFSVGNSGQGNGLSMPNFILNGQREVEAIYAGDLQGNLWKFDVSSTSSIDWNVAFSGQPLFTTAGGKKQPITVMPEISANDAGGAMLTFGTGKMFEPSDTSSDTAENINLNTQAIYSVWDKPSQTSGISGGVTVLQQRTAPVITAAPSPAPKAGEFQSMDLTLAENKVAINWTDPLNTKRGWYVNLTSGGERVNVNPQQFKRNVFLIANRPDIADPCSQGGMARVFALDPQTGLPPVRPVFDVNGDGSFTTDDVGNIVVNRKGVLTQPVFQLSAISGLSITPSVSVSPLSIFNRGQATGGRAGGVELSRSYGGSLVPAGSPCSGVMSSGSSDTTVMTVGVNCFEPSTTAPSTKKQRISWKQLK